MDIKVKFRVEALHETEARELFIEFVGDLGKSPQYKDLLTDVVNECGGLPLVIKTVARALKDRSKDRWETALNELRNSLPENIADMSGSVYQSLKMSYDSLESEEQKSLLLLCGMFPEDTLISADESELLMYSVGQGLLKHVETYWKRQERSCTV
ncbi:NB-ARC domain containing protein [Trema orientale]|uniref:NB-ARC domain containing protein n=1 Tax=Trema orientale TaxID=63057 RepID=A0A2P5FIP5_TREOI|nr:NB-ARC domain containing protein [Trema orientale]